MENIIITNIYIFFLAIVLAVLEIQIEGKNGWAMNLPTWRPRSNNFFVNIYQKIMSGRELTGYHITIFGFVFLVFHLPYFFSYNFNLINWSMTISLFFIFIILWDFLWFVLNPHHPLKKFKKEHIWWHKKWFWGIPRDYYGGIMLSLLVILPVILYYDLPSLFYWWLINMIFFCLGTLFVIWFSFGVLHIDNWKK